MIDAYFSATKIRWILDNVPGARGSGGQRGELLFGTVETWLIWKLTKGTGARDGLLERVQNHAVQYQYAPVGTTRFWKELGIPKSLLPDSHAVQLRLRGNGSLVPGRPDPHRGSRGRSAGRSLRTDLLRAGRGEKHIRNRLLPPDEHRERNRYSPINGLVTTIAWGLDGKVNYALEGSIFVAGASIQWLRDEMRLIDSAEDSDYMARKGKGHQRLLCGSRVHRTGGAALGSVRPRNDCGDHPGCEQNITSSGATLESIAYQVYDVLAAMKADSGIPPGGSEGGRRRQRQRFPAADAGGHHQRAGQPAGLRGDNLPWAPPIWPGLAAGYWKDKEDVIRNWAV